MKDSDYYDDDESDSLSIETTTPVNLDKIKTKMTFSDFLDFMIEIPFNEQTADSKRPEGY